ncbi:hypothetical protein [Cellulomonas triticagri]|uniref:hypothetical protein n=1 Tax=Cellulomonas triticagri TaxID=2483352 RepID=UPI0011C381D5|nr:hypothetical protein [Cellulomonas triticagri]
MHENALVSVDAVTSEEDGAVVVRIPLADLPGADDGGSWTVLPDIAVAESVHDDPVEAPLDTVVIVEGASSRVVGPESSTARRGSAGTHSVDGVAWAVEISVLWAVPFDGATAATYSRPEVVLVTATGPGPVPPGARVVLTVDRRVTGELTVVSAAADDGKPVAIAPQWEVDDDLGILGLTLTEPIPAGRSVRVTVEGSEPVPADPEEAARLAANVRITSGSTRPELQLGSGRDDHSIII